MASSITEKSLSGMVWVLTDKFGSTAVNLLVGLILARLLTEEDFGILAMVIIFFDVSTTIVYSGFPAALIREKEISEADKSTTFFFNLFAAVVLYIILYSSAPYIADYFKNQQLQPIVRVMSLNLIIFSFSIIQRTLLDREIHFKTQAKTRLSGIVISGIVAIAMAFAGYGVWSLVAKFIIVSLVDTILLWLVSGWRPELVFSISSFKRLFSFGSKLLATNFLDRSFTHIFKLVIGRVFSVGVLGYYHWASTFKNLAITSLFQTIQRISYPVLSKLNTGRAQLKAGYRKVIILSSFVIIPSMAGMGLLAEPLIVTLIGEKWLPVVPFLQLLCISGLIFHFNAININMLLVIGRSDLSLKLEIIKKAGIIIAIVIGIEYGIYGLVMGEVAAAYMALLINTYYSKKFLDYPLTEQLADIRHTVLFSALMGLLVFSISHWLVAPAPVRFILGTVVGVAAYFGLHFVSQSAEIKFLRDEILPKAQKMLNKSH